MHNWYNVTAWDLISSLGIGLAGLWFICVVLAFAQHHDDKRKRRQIAKEEEEHGYW